MASQWRLRLCAALVSGVLVVVGFAVAVVRTDRAPAAAASGRGFTPATALAAARLAAVPAAAADVVEGERASRLQVASDLAAAASRTEEPVRLGWPAVGGLTGWWQEVRGHRTHPGIDIDGETGDPILAAGKGTVTHAGPAPAGYGGYGNLVLIDHGQGVVTLYAHLTDVMVAAGQQVTMGQQVGTMGVTGNVTGSHLHFEVRVNNVAVDPGPWLPAR